MSFENFDAHRIDAIYKTVQQMKASEYFSTKPTNMQKGAITEIAQYVLELPLGSSKIFVGAFYHAVSM